MQAQAEGSSPRVTVAMPARNAERWIVAAIDSIRAQTLPDWELIIIDDGSTDRTAAMAQRCADADPRIGVLRREPRGITFTRNRILDLARGHYLAMQDADDICEPSRLALQVAYLEAHPECALVSCRMLLTDPAGRPIRVINVESSHEAIDAVNMGGEGFFVCGAYMARLDAVREAGGFRTDSPLVEDRDLFLRLAERHRLACLEQVLYRYRRHWHSSTQRDQAQVSQCIERSIADARRRRGLPPIEHSPQPASSGSPAQTQRIWAWWSLQSGYVQTARRYALAALLRAPWSSDSWRIAGCALRGR